MPIPARPLPSRCSRASLLVLPLLLALAACSEKPKPAPEPLTDAALPMSPSPGDLLPTRLPGFFIELSGASPKRSEVLDNVVALVRREDAPAGEPVITLALGRIDGASIDHQWEKLFDGFEKPALGLTFGVHDFVLHARKVRAGALAEPEAHGGSTSLLWFRYFRDVPVMVFASDEALGRRFLDELCKHWAAMAPVQAAAR